MHNLYENADFNCKRMDIADQFCLYIHRPQFNHNTHMYICNVTQNLYKNSAYRSSTETIFTMAFKLLALFLILWTVFKVSVKENEVPTEKNSSRASIFATKASYISN